METFRLMSMTDFVLEYAPKFNPFGTDEQILCLDYIHNYAKFLKQPLKLEMFVPCDEFNILEEPIFHEPNNENEIGNYQILIDEYYEAKEKVLFEGFKFYYSYTDSIYVADKEINLIQFKNNGDVYVLDEFLSNSISDLIFYFQKEKINLTLTENAIKQIGL